MSRTSHLSESFRLPCGATLKNRVAKAALTERLSKPDMLPNELHMGLYDHWAKFGSAMLLSGNILVDKRYLESTGNIVIEKHTPKDSFKQWTATVTRQNCHFWAQLNHAGRQSSIFSTRQPVSPSDVQLKKMGLFAKPRPMKESDIEDTIERFVYAAQFCKEVGFTGVQIHGAHGYLISQFLSPRTNLRTDRWGGSVENRARFLLEIIKRIRLALGAQFPISLKLNSSDFQKGGFDEGDSLQVIKLLEPYQLDLLEISGGTYERSAMFGLGLKESTQQREAYFIDFAQKIRSHTSTPLMITGGVRSASFCETVLKEGSVDIIGFGRPYLIDETFPQSLLSDPNSQVIDPHFTVLDRNNADAAEAGYYDLQIKRLAKGKGLNHSYSGIRLASHIGWVEMKKGLMNRLLG